MLPVVIVDLSEEEEALVLATLDPLSELAEIDQEALDRLLAEVEVTDTTLMELLADLGSEQALDALEAEAAGQGGGETDSRSGVEPEAPSEFPAFGEDIATDHCCPKCGYRWSGKTDAGGSHG